MSEYNANGGYQPEKSATEGVPPQERALPYKLTAAIIGDAAEIKARDGDCELAHAAIALIKEGIGGIEDYEDGSAGREVCSQMIRAGIGMIQSLKHYVDAGDAFITEFNANKERDL